MKKMNFLLSMMMLVMAGCSAGDMPPEPPPTPPAQSVPAQQPNATAPTTDGTDQEKGEAPSDNQSPPLQGADALRLRLTFEGGEATVVLQDNPTSQSLLDQLPVTVTLDDFAGAEKIAYFPKKLSTEGGPNGYDPALGDVACYGPWGNVAIYYKDQSYATGLIPMGTIESGLDLLAAIDSDTAVTISRIT